MADRPGPYQECDPVRCSEHSAEAGIVHANQNVVGGQGLDEPMSGLGAGIAWNADRIHREAIRRYDRVLKVRSGGDLSPTFCLICVVCWPMGWTNPPFAARVEDENADGSGRNGLNRSPCQADG